MSFASAVHAPADKSFWAAARRALILFDWLGHGRNRAKLHEVGTLQHAHVSKCRHCGLPDSQAHCMLDCTHRSYDPLRKEARVDQSRIAAQLLDDTICEDMKYFIQMLYHASWTPTDQTSRLWLGTWQLNTLQSLLGFPPEQRLSAQKRHAYIRAVKKMTEPLLRAYRKMLNINIRTLARTRPSRTEDPSHQEDPLPLYDHLPPATIQSLLFTTDVLSTCPLFPNDHLHILENLFIQHPDPTSSSSSLHNAISTLDTLNPYSISDAAFSIEEADGAF